jgi:cell division protein FtsB
MGSIHLMVNHQLFKQIKKDNRKHKEDMIKEYSKSDLYFFSKRVFKNGKLC